MTFKEKADAWQTKLQRFLPFPFFWISISAVILFVGYIILIFFEKNLDNLTLIFLEAIILAALANGAVFFEMLLDDVADSFPKLLNHDAEVTEKWLNKWYQNIFWSYNNIYAGIGFSIGFVALSLSVIPGEFETMAGQIMAFSILGVLGFFTGSLAWIMIGIARMTSSLGKEVRIRFSVFDTTTSPLRAAASIMWKVSLYGSLLFVLGISVHPICSIVVTPTQFYVNTAGGVGILLYFMIPQINIHKSLKRTKQSRLTDLVRQIDANFDCVANDPSMDNINRLKELFNLQRIVDNQKSWSFGARELMTLIGSIVIPLVLFALSYYLQQI